MLRLLYFFPGVLAGVRGHAGFADVMRDVDRRLRQSVSPTRLPLAQNWFEELRRLVPVE